MDENILDEDLQRNYHLPERRRGLLPLWIKIFCWVFMFAGGIIPFIFIIGIWSSNTHLEIYGFETTDPFSWIGILIVSIFLIKAIVAYGLWFEKKWAIQAGIIDGFIGIVICVMQMLMGPVNGSGFSFRFEIIILILFLIKLRKIRDSWENHYDQ